MRSNGLGETPMATVATSTQDRLASERKFYTRMALFLAFIVLLGFGPSFFLRGVVPSYPRPNPTLTPPLADMSPKMATFAIEKALSKETTPNPPDWKSLLLA